MVSNSDYLNKNNPEQNFKSKLAFTALCVPTVTHFYLLFNC